MTIKEIVKKYLEENGYDGLASPDLECGCPIDDLMPCDKPNAEECVSGHKSNVDGDIIFVPGKAVKE